jgi:DNA polymerase-1
MRTLLIDGDIWAYRACTSTEVEVQWDEDTWSLWGDFDQAKSAFDGAIDNLQKQLDADKVIIALSDTENFRKTVMPTYKQNRKKLRKPVTYRPLREYIHEKHNTFQRPGLEGDDILGILATSKRNVDGEKIVVSIDKDMHTIPGFHVNYNEAKKEGYAESIRFVTPEEADFYHMMQTIAGDHTDGYPGVPGVGPVTAERVLREGKILEPKGKKWIGTTAGSLWQIVVSVYRSKGLSEEEALRTARVARILRASDYNFSTKEPKLWCPPVAQECTPA